MTTPTEKTPSFEESLAMAIGLMLKSDQAGITKAAKLAENLCAHRLLSNAIRNHDIVPATLINEDHFPSQSTTADVVTTEPCATTSSSSSSVSVPDIATVQDSSVKMTPIDNYNELTIREHVIAYPDTYVGSTAIVQRDMYINDNGKSVKKSVAYCEALYNIVDAVFMHAAKNTEFSNVKINIDADGRIIVENSGMSNTIIIGNKTAFQMSEKQFDTFPCTTNDSSAMVLANIFSSEFHVDVNYLHFSCTWKNNMTLKLPKGCPRDNEQSSFSINFIPDYARLGMPNGLSPDMKAVLQHRVYEIAAVKLGTQFITVDYNGRKVPAHNFRDYIRLFTDSYDKIIYHACKNWRVGAVYSPGNGDIVSFVNGKRTNNGGTHVNHVVEVGNLNLSVSVKRKNLRKNCLIFFIDYNIENPKVSDISYNELTSRITNPFQPDNDFFTKLHNTCHITSEVNVEQKYDTEITNVQSITLAQLYPIAARFQKELNEHALKDNLEVQFSPIVESDYLFILRATATSQDKHYMSFNCSMRIHKAANSNNKIKIRCIMRGFFSNTVSDESYQLDYSCVTQKTCWMTSMNDIMWNAGYKFSLMQQYNKSHTLESLRDIAVRQEQADEAESNTDPVVPQKLVNNDIDESSISVPIIGTRSPQLINDDIAKKFVKTIAYIRELTYPSQSIDHESTIINLVDANGFYISHAKKYSTILYRIIAKVIPHSTDLKIECGIANINNITFIVSLVTIKAQYQLNSDNDDIYQIVRKMFALRDTASPTESNKLVNNDSDKSSSSLPIADTRSPQLINDDIANKFIKAIAYIREFTYLSPIIEHKSTFINFVNAEGFSIVHSEQYSNPINRLRLYRINAKLFTNSTDFKIEYGIIKKDGKLVGGDSIVASQQGLLNSDNDDINQIVRKMFALKKDNE